MSQPPGLPDAKRCYATLNGHRYHYLLSQKGDSYTDTIVLIHGFPDLSYGWRRQIPFLTELGFRVVAIDTLGYGGTDAPHDDDIKKELQYYTAKNNATAIKELIEHLAGEEGKKAEPAIVVGHDWGSFIAQRFALWYPELIKALCIVCVPWTAVTHQQVSIDDVIKKLPNFAYQKQFASGDVEKRIAEVGERGLENFVLFGAGGMTEERKPLFNPRTGIDLKALGGKIHPTLYNDKDELAYVTEEYKRHGAHPPLNAYRVMPMNVEDEKALPKSTDTKIEIRTLFIRALQDEALPPYMSTGMENYFADGALTIKDIDANHFVMLEAPDKFNNTLKEWLVGLSGVGSRTKAAL